jgi:hypothetical protein
MAGLVWTGHRSSVFKNRWNSEPETVILSGYFCLSAPLFVAGLAMLSHRLC